MHRHHHLFGRIAALENLIGAGKAALRGKRRRPQGSEFFGDFEKEVFALHDDGERQEWAPGGDLFNFRTIKRGLPIGNLTSQFFANVYLNPLDHFVKHELRVRGYVRYMDDFLLFGDERAVLRTRRRRMRPSRGE